MGADFAAQVPLETDESHVDAPLGEDPSDRPMSPRFGTRTVVLPFGTIVMTSSGDTPLDTAFVHFMQAVFMPDAPVDGGDGPHLDEVSWDHVPDEPMGPPPGMTWEQHVANSREEGRCPFFGHKCQCRY